MRRLVLLFDGTWNTLLKPDEVTNVVRVGQAVKTLASDGVQQIVYYNSGVGSGGAVDSLLGGVFGAGIKSNVKRGLTFLSFNYDNGEESGGQPDEIYIFGFSRGAYTARALAGVIGAIRGIPKVSNFGEAEELWTHYRTKKSERDEKRIKELVYENPEGNKLVKCVAVWDTVGSYGIPTGFGLAGLARSITSWTRNFRDNEIGPHIGYGLHAMAIDERRRAFAPTAWVNRETPLQPPATEPKVEQVWFAGAHANVGGGYKQTGLSDQSLVWMIAHIEEETGLQFDEDYIAENFWPCAACSAYRSNKGWWLSRVWPAIRAIPKHLAGTRALNANPKPGEIVDGRVHWSVQQRQNRLSLVDENSYATYTPKNLKPPFDVAEPSPRETQLIQGCYANKEHPRRASCALRKAIDETEPGWWRWRARTRWHRMCNLRKSWEDILATEG